MQDIEELRGKKLMPIWRQWTLKVLFGVTWVVLLGVTFAPAHPAHSSTSQKGQEAVAVAFATVTPPPLYETETCPAPFQDLAYRGKVNLPAPQIVPPAPWNAVTSVPSDLYKGDRLARFQVVLARTVEGKREIWIQGRYIKQEQNKTANVPLLLVYRPHNDSWENIPVYVAGSDTPLSVLWETQNGELWAIVRSSEEAHPFFAKFNPTERRFEFVAQSPVFPTESLRENLRVFLDQHDTFWTFIAHDGVYSYRPADNALTKWVDLVDRDAYYSTLAPDGSLYFSEIVEPLGVSVNATRIFRLNPETGEVEQVQLPPDADNWPVYSGLFVDREGRLWLSAVGYRDAEGTWHFLHPDPETYFRDVYGSHGFLMSPTPILESSDGRLWFHKFVDGSRFYEGLAWYDPRSGEGCLVTNWATNIVEDSEQSLWMIVDKVLYRLTLR